MEDAEPTRTRPGTLERIEVYCQRYEAGLSLHASGDINLENVSLEDICELIDFTPLSRAQSRKKTCQSVSEQAIMTDEPEPMYDLTHLGRDAPGSLEDDNDPRELHLRTSRAQH